MNEKMLDVQTITREMAALERDVVRLRQTFRTLILPATAPQTTRHPYVESVSEILSGEPVVKGTRTPVRAIVEHWKFGDSPEEVLRHLPHLRLAEVFDALSYYDDHREEIERYIALNRTPVDVETITRCSPSLVLDRQIQHLAMPVCSCGSDDPL